MLEAVKNKQVKEDKQLGFDFVKRFILQPVKSGFFGFAIFFTILIATKFLGFLINTQETFSISLEDVLLSLIGFVLIFLIRLLENIKED